MATADDLVVVCTYAEREAPAALGTAFRMKKIKAIVVPSTHLIGAWDVRVSAHAAVPSREGLVTVLARD